MIGKKVVEVRALTDVEMAYQGWEYGGTTALVFDDGTIIFASCDDEGNGPGRMFGTTPDGKDIFIGE